MDRRNFLGTFAAFIASSRTLGDQASKPQSAACDFGDVELDIDYETSTVTITHQGTANELYTALQDIYDEMETVDLEMPIAALDYWTYRVNEPWDSWRVRLEWNWRTYGPGDVFGHYVKPIAQIEPGTTMDRYLEKRQAFVKHAKREDD